MAVEKVYYFEWEKYGDALEELYPIIGIGGFDVSILTKDRLDKLMKVLHSVISDIKSREKTDLYDVDEEITCLSEQAKVSFEGLFANKDLILYGHGGAVDKIVESGKFTCKCCDLGSHFVCLEKSNESLSKLNAWPHRRHTQIAILALNAHEHNPIYIDNSAVESARDNYEIPLEYFAGWYDAVRQLFVPNPMFKVSHSYNPAATIYPGQEHYSGSFRGINLRDNLICDFIYNLELIRYLLIHSSIKGLNLNGLMEIQKQFLRYIEKAYQLQEHITPEYLEKVMSSQIENDYGNIPVSGIVGVDDWHGWGEDWGEGWGDELEPQPKGR